MDGAATVAPTRPALARWRGRLAAGIRELRAGNPVLIKELRTRMRGARAFWVVAAYLGLISVIVLVVYYNFWQQWRNASLYQYGYQGSAATIGRHIFLWLFCAQGVLISLITPAFTAAAITAEREQRSYEMLTTSCLSAGAIVRGKLGAAVLFVVLLLTASLPLAGVSLLFGGVSPAQIFFAYLVLAGTAYLYGAVGIFWSARVRRTAAATVGAYVTATLLFYSSLGSGLASTSYASHHNAIPFQSLNGAMAPVRAVEVEQFLRWPLPSWIAGLAGNLVMGTLFAVLAAEQLEGFLGRRPGIRRATATLAWALGWAAVLGAMVGYYYFALGPARHTLREVRPDTLQILFFACYALLLTTPLLVTARSDTRRPRRLSDWLRIFSPREWFRDTLPGGAGLALLWAALPVLILAGGFLAVGGWRVLVQSGVLAPLAAVLGAFWLAIVGIGYFWSAVERRPWMPAICAYATLLLLALAPQGIVGPMNPADQEDRARRGAWHLSYLLPAEGLRRLAALPPPSLATRAQQLEARTADPRYGLLAFDGFLEVWQVTALCYSLVGLVSLGGAAACFGGRRRAAPRVDAPTDTAL